MKKRLILLVLFLFISLVGCGQGFSSIQGVSGQGRGEKDGGNAGISEQTGEETSFEVHFIDVGQADAALVLCDGESMLIDGGNRGDSSLIYTYLKQRGLEHLDYMICTHPHEDHVGGLVGALNYATADVAYAPVTDYDSEVFRDFKKYLEQQGREVDVPTAGETFMLGSAEVSVVGPANMDTGSNPNNMSIVLRVVYGDTSFLFTGDAEREEEQGILEAGYEIKSTVLKVGHHGGASSTTYPFLREVQPEYAVISVGEGNSYGHPTEDVLSRLRDADVEVYRTDMQGTVVCVSDGEKVFFEPAKLVDTADVSQPVVWQEDTVAVTDTDYILNTNSGKFHYPTCESVFDMKESNKQYYHGGREELEGQGYSPCRRCKP